MNDFTHLLAAPDAAIFNSSFREGVLPKLWKSTTVISLPKKHPPCSVQNDIRPISLTPILAKVFESLVLEWVDNTIKPQIDDSITGITGTCTIDVLVEILHKWYEATDTMGTFVRVLLLDYSKAFDLNNNEKLIDKLVKMNLPPHLVR